MTDPRPTAPPHDEAMRRILDTLLREDETITARAVARLHPTIQAASSITRSESRRTLLADYQRRQEEYRRWHGRSAKQSGADTAASLADKSRRIAELESQVALLTASHLALLRAVGELGGFSQWAAFFGEYREARDALNRLGAEPKMKVVESTGSLQSRNA